MNTSPLLTAFDIGKQPELIAIVGGGGKTSLMFALAKALPGNVIITTTTRIFAAQMKLATAVCTTSDLSQLGQHLTQHGSCLVIGDVQGDKAVGVDPALPGQLLARLDVDFVIVEADGSRMRPIKAPAAHEPVIPPDATLVIPVIGIDALDGPIEKVAHRPELVRSVIGELYSVSGDRLTAADVAALLVHPAGGMKNVPERARVIPLINKVETESHLQTARQIAHHSLVPSPQSLVSISAATHSPISHIVLGAIKTPQPIREVQRRVTAVILAAGEAKRMGQMKQLLAWGDTTVLGQTIRQAKQSLAHDVWVVSGHRAQEVEAIAQQEGAYVRRNIQYASGEMLSSLQTAVAQLPPHTAAVLVMLADQPMIEPDTLNQLLIAFWQGQGELIAPVFAGKRGNPVLIGRAHFAQLLSLPIGDAPRTLLQKHPVHLVPVPTDSIVRDLDSPEDYEREQMSRGAGEKS
ncbi:MAG: putative selenium-dependent hydroxylase accessory protein YqeC [Ardenticatenaceae bacterium]|nr:putative selenium-dependent hydroxylase accessory protein YqeC [Ardenticatenaceae bacterium]